MKPNNKIKLKKGTLRLALSTGRDGGVLWNKGPVLLSKLILGSSSSAGSPMRPDGRYITTDDKRGSSRFHPEEEYQS